MREIVLAVGQLYHVFNRGVDKRILFHEVADYRKFCDSLYLFNDANYRNPGNVPLYNETLLAAYEALEDLRDPFVDILSYCLIPNHFHLMLRQCKDGGISKFLHKLQLGYGHYYNRKYGRTGRLIESTFKAVPIEYDGHLLHLPRYIHMNALDDIAPDWRDGKITDWQRARVELDSYRWSSHHLYRGDTQELPIVRIEAVHEVLGDLTDYDAFLSEWATRSTPFSIVGCEE